MIRLSTGVVLQRLGDETVLLDSLEGRYFDLNATGSWMLDQLLSGLDQGQLVSALQGRYGIDADVAESDLGRLLQQLTEARLIEGN